MGGDLFKLGRLPRREYAALEADLRIYLDEHLGDRYRIPRYYDDKPDFGDLDIVVSNAVIDTTWADFMRRTMSDLGVTDHIHTAGVFSTVWRDFQVDYFVRDEAYFLSTYHFLCYNDLGNLLGRIFRRMNLKYGERGLEYVYRRDVEGSYKQVLPVSLDMERILEFIELDYSTWHAGFADLDALYRWVTTSPWFSASPYLDPASPMRSRAKMRPTMQKFLTWLQENPVAESTRSFAHRDDALPLIEAAFPEAKLLEAMRAEKQREVRSELVRSKFSGQRVMTMFPDLQDQRLGHFIRTFRDLFEDFECDIAEMPPDAVDEAVHAHRVWFDQQEIPPP